MERVHLKRKLTAVLLADVVGYSRLMSVDEEGTHIRLADCVKTVIEPTVALHEGRLLRSKGDGLLVEFDSAVNAVNCAVDIQRGLATYDDAAGDRKLQLRIGINSGDVIVQENDVYGNSVNIAARLEGLAEPGGISVTAAVREQLRGHPGLFSRTPEIDGSRILTAQFGSIALRVPRRENLEAFRTPQGSLVVSSPDACFA